jgi:hypothetical protein
MTPAEKKWLQAIALECDMLRLDLGARGTTGTVSFKILRALMENKVEVTETTWEVKNLIASVATSDPTVLRGRITLVNAAIERLAKTGEYIKQEMTNANT